ncbi:MAG: nuclear transport factor 2 family protein [Bacteroidales bacterium]|nr:nuclear transport factor 2 family protein [Bacteroidales bacterium]
MTLEERITRLEDIEYIRNLQARYQRCLDTRDFDGIADCFTNTVTSSYGNGTMSYQGKDEVLHFLCDVMTLDMPSTHLIHGGEVDVLDCTHAHAKWYLEDHLLHQKFLVKLHGAAIYDVDYVKCEDRWLIQNIGYERCYEYFEFRGLLNILTLRKKTFLDRVKTADPNTLGQYGRDFQWNILRKKKK